MNEAIFILGAGGFLGRRLAVRLASAGHQVIAATRRPVTFDQVRIHNVVATWDESGQFAQWLPRCGAVVHAASSSTPGASMAAPQIDGNLRTTLALIEALQRYYETRLLYLSSAGTLYGERDVPAIESSPLRPRSYHGAGKAAAEQFIHAWAMQYQGTAFVIRPSNVYGPGQTARHGFAIVPTAMDHAVSGAPLEIWGDGTQLRDYLYVDDLMSLCMKVIDARVPDGCHIFNAASGNAITLNDLVERIEVVSGRAIPRMHAPARAADVGKVLVSAETARIVFGWVADISLDEGLMRTWAWYQSNT